MEFIKVVTDKKRYIDLLLLADEEEKMIDKYIKKGEMKMSQILIKNAYIVSMNEKREVFNGGSILIEDDKIVAVGKVADTLVKADAEIYDAQGKIIMPGLVNTHVHLS